MESAVPQMLTPLALMVAFPWQIVRGRRRRRTYRWQLRTPFAMCGTDIRNSYATCGTETGRCYYQANETSIEPLEWLVPCELGFYEEVVSAYAPAMRCPRMGYAIPGTDIADAAILYALSGSDIAYDATRHTDAGIAYAAAGYAISGTDVAYAAIVLRAHYTMSGTDVAYAHTRYSCRRIAMCLRACYAKSGTDLGCAAARWLCNPYRVPAASTSDRGSPSAYALATRCPALT
eukprot:3859665-Rhodomonas_salina.3